MILYCAADNNYFNLYFDLWNKQTNKIYPELKRHIALYNPSEEHKQKCVDNNIDFNDVTLGFPKNPKRNHFYLLRWLFLPTYYNENILETQINCLPLKKFNYPKIQVEQWRIQRPKRGVLGGVSAAIFTPDSARKVINQAKSMIHDPPENDHEMNMWQINNLSQHQEKLEHQITDDKSGLPDHAYWITSRTAQVWTHEQKLKALERFCK